MTLYYIEITQEKGIKVYIVNSDNRHKFWNTNPKAREISRKDYEKICQIANNTKQQTTDETN